MGFVKKKKNSGVYGVKAGRVPVLAKQTSKSCPDEKIVPVSPDTWETVISYHDPLSVISSIA